MSKDGSQDRVVSAGLGADIIRRAGEVRTQSVTHSFTGPGHGGDDRVRRASTMLRYCCFSLGLGVGVNMYIGIF